VDARRSYSEREASSARQRNQEHNERFLHRASSDSIMRQRTAANKAAAHAGHSIVSREELWGADARDVAVTARGRSAKVGSRFPN
jgi:hypothetical protein